MWMVLNALMFQYFFSQDFPPSFMGRKRRSCSRTDRINNLPHDVVDNIIKYLSLWDSVRTSILSRWWRYKWTTIPYVVFDRDFKEKLSRNYSLDFVIYQVLLLHKGPIVKFIYDPHHTPDNYRRAMDHWLLFLSNHRIEELKLRFSYFPDVHCAISHHLFSFHHLKYLCLVNFKLILPSAFKGFGKLIRLDLDNLFSGPKALKGFISKCPMLEYLNLYRCMPDLEIDAPNLKSFQFFFTGEPPSISLKNTLMLEEVAITLYNKYSLPAYFDCFQNLIDLFSQLSFIRKLELNGGSLQFLEIGNMVEKLCSNLNRDNLSHLMVLRLIDIDFVSLAEVTCVVCLIRSSPNLQSLEITSKTTLDDDVKPATQYLKEHQKCRLTHCHLRNVKISAFLGSKPEMEFVKLLLSAACALTTLTLELALEPEPEYSFYIIERNPAYQDPRMLKKLLKFHRASPEAKIII